MARLLCVLSISLVLVCCAGAASVRSGTANARYRSVGVGHVSGGRFGGVGSFSSGRILYSPFQFNAAGIRGHVSGVNDLITSHYSRGSSSMSSSSSSFATGGTNRFIRRWKIASRG
ncbi:unnamed protein product [Chrysodeixis includens]|uniref:Secreted protein n=1 Tax=Chrysodeixis includens TaxID=689277 RepID=A0A9P0BQR1_CHRIL|nr:unnamed protein product [Chrysodeixis includens]